MIPGIGTLQILLCTFHWSLNSIIYKKRNQNFENNLLPLGLLVLTLAIRESLKSP